MTEPTLQEMERACAEHAGIETKTVCALDYRADGLTCSYNIDDDRCNKDCKYRGRVNPTGMELVERLKAWLVENSQRFGVRYEGEQRGWSAGVEDEGATHHFIRGVAIEHEAFIRAYYAAFCKEKP